MTSTFRCSAAAREDGLDLVGTAGSYTDFLLVEHPLPWPRDAKEVVKVRAPKGRDVRLQLVVAPDGDMAPLRRVVHWSRVPAQPFGGFRRSEVAVDPDDVRAACDELLAGTVPPAAVPVRDVLVCTHGNRDRCCGRLGILLLDALGDVPPDVRLWRTSHTGGHRFAPTGVTFPDGVFWGYLDDGGLDRVLRREGDVSRNFRGCSGLDSPAAQAVDREAFARFGWDWLGTPRTAVTTGDHVELRSEARIIWASTEVARRVPVLDCGVEPTGDEKRQPELRVSRFVVSSPR
ncbi:MAG TPA: sucrase ferredoxin [Acidimicrobiales bacterium]|nr:sucrase ferredoxin [Acidimicrobiales bacterium]